MWSQGDYARLAPWLEPHAEALAAVCGIGPGTKVLDVGAGNGNFALAAFRRGATVTASDVTPRMVALCRAPVCGRKCSHHPPVVTPGGLLAMANYSSQGFLGQLATLAGNFSPPAPVEMPSPFLWGDPDELRRRLASSIDIVPRTLTFEFDSFED